MQNALILINYEVEVAAGCLPAAVNSFLIAIFGPSSEVIGRLSKAAQSLAETRGSQSAAGANEWVEWTNPKVQIRNNLNSKHGSVRKEPGIWNGVPFKHYIREARESGLITLQWCKASVASHSGDPLSCGISRFSGFKMPLCFSNAAPFSTVILSLSPIPISPHGCLWKSQGETIWKMPLSNDGNILSCPIFF